MLPELRPLHEEETIRLKGLSDVDGFYHHFTIRPDMMNRKKVVRVKQVHSDNILVVDRRTFDLDLFRNSRIFNNGYDALITNQDDIILEIRTADCLPILIIDPHNRAIAAVHAGWRGSLLNLPVKVVQKMKEFFGSREEELIVGFGPSIGPCCYDVGDDVLEPIRERHPKWTDIIEERDKGKRMLNLEGLNRRQLLDLGIREERTFSVNLCTSCHPVRLPSYRRDGKVIGNIYSGIMMETV
ncbi:MAG: peptidoglycan editing factor PgeF [Nitrospirota bacterium]